MFSSNKKYVKFITYNYINECNKISSNYERIYQRVKISKYIYSKKAFSYVSNDLYMNKWNTLYLLKKKYYKKKNDK